MNAKNFLLTKIDPCTTIFSRHLSVNSNCFERSYSKAKHPYLSILTLFI